jgi:hypothetical protein
MGRLLRTVFTNDGLLVANNLLSGPGTSNESDSEIRFVGNLLRDASGAFADPAHGDLHLTQAADEIIDQGAALPAPVGEDIDRQHRDSQPDIGADERI